MGRENLDTITAGDEDPVGGLYGGRSNLRAVLAEGTDATAGWVRTWRSEMKMYTYVWCGQLGAYMAHVARRAAPSHTWRTVIRYSGDR